MSKRKSPKAEPKESAPKLLPTEDRFPVAPGKAARSLDLGVPTSHELRARVDPVARIVGLPDQVYVNVGRPGQPSLPGELAGEIARAFLIEEVRGGEVLVDLLTQGLHASDAWSQPFSREVLGFSDAALAALGELRELARSRTFIDAPAHLGISGTFVRLTWTQKPAQDRPVEPPTAPRPRKEPPATELADAALPALDAVQQSLDQLRAGVRTQLEATLAQLPDRPLAPAEARQLAHTLMDMADALGCAYACPGPDGKPCGQPARITATHQYGRTFFRFRHSGAGSQPVPHAERSALTGLRLVPAPADKRRKP